MSGAVAQVRLRYDFGVLQLDDATRLVVVFRERRQEVLPSMELVTIDHNLPQRVRPRDLRDNKQMSINLKLLQSFS